MFYGNVPIGAAALAFGAIFLRQRTETQPGHFDLAGFLLSGIDLGLVMYGVSEGPDLGWGSAEVLATVAAGAALLIAMVAVEQRNAGLVVVVGWSLLAGLVRAVPVVMVGVHPPVHSACG